MATIRRKSAVVDFGKFPLSGFDAWLLWGLVGVNWSFSATGVAVTMGSLWSYVTYERVARLITSHDT
jgi:NADH dehydrogenase FAD-containing subunit